MDWGHTQTLTGKAGLATVGRAIRPHPDKEEGWIVDLAGNLPRFGEVKDLRLVDGGNGKWAVYSNNRQLTNVRF